MSERALRAALRTDSSPADMSQANYGDTLEVQHRAGLENEISRRLGAMSISDLKLVRQFLDSLTQASTSADADDEVEPGTHFEGSFGSNP